MSQVIRQTVTVGATAVVIPSTGAQPLRCNVSYKETAGVACTVTCRGPDGDEADSIPGLGSGLVRDKLLTQVMISGNGAVVVLDARVAPTFIDPQYLNVATNAGDGVITLIKAIPHLSNVEVFVCPPGTRARVLGFIYTDGGSGTNLSVLIGNSGGFTADTFTEAICINQSVSSSAQCTYGPSSADTITRNADQFILPGQSLYVSGSGASASKISLAILEEPL